MYATKSGTTKKCSDKLAELIPDTIICNFREKPKNIEQFPNIILGSYVRMNKIDHSLVRFMKKYSGILIEKKVGVFVCCLSKDEPSQIMKKIIPETLRKGINRFESFGGELDLSKLNGMYKIIMKAMIENPDTGVQTEYEIDESAIKSFAEYFLC